MLQRSVPGASVVKICVGAVSFVVPFASLTADIEAGRRTAIDLNEEQLPPRAQGGQWVRVPSGQIVGAKSQ